nr:HWE histidine kinase domain-containing protein [Chthonobacter rhizosphaerae]
MLEELTAGALALEESQDHYRHTIELNPQVTWTARPDGELDRVAARWQDWTGTSGLGDSWGDAIHEDDLQRTIDAWRTSCATGTGYDVRHRIRMKSGEYRWMRSRAFPRRNPDGTIVGWYGTTEDIDGEKIAEDRQLLLIRELHHRVKNTLATVQAVMGSTARASTSMQEFQEAFSARIAALARTHTLLTGDQWQQVSFRDLFDAELAPYADCRRITLSGPHLELSSDIAVPLGMAIHELTTNAAKYGALSAANGAIEVDWTLRRDAPASVTWCWRETGGPPVRPPTHAGFGTKLLQRVLKQQIGAEVQFRYGSPGLVVEAVIPLP